VLTHFHPGRDGVAGLQDDDTSLRVDVDDTFQVVTDLH
jgi:hypothetical protein